MERNFAKLYSPNQRLSVDEGMIAYKGRLSFEQDLPAKPSKYCIKFFAICDSVTGYCMRVEIYSGGDEMLSCESAFNVVNELISPYTEYNHILYTDNFYTSVKLARYLRGFRTHLVGTVRKNSKLFPEFWNQTVQPDENLKLVDGFGIVACRWRIGTKRDLYMLSTISDGRDVEVANELPLVRPTTKPAMVVDYNKYKGGVDKFNQLRNYYSTGHHAKKWWKVMFFNLLDMAIANAHICHKLKYDTSHFNFRKLLVRELFGNIDVRKKRSALDEPSSSGSPPISSFEDHILVDSGKLIVCLYCAQEGRRAPKSAIRTKFRCLKCNKGFCRYSKRDCFYKYHNLL